MSFFLTANGTVTHKKEQLWFFYYLTQNGISYKNIMTLNWFSATPENRLRGGGGPEAY